MKFCLVIVLYKTNWHESESIVSLMTNLDVLRGSTIIIWDNSPESQDTSHMKDIVQSYDITLCYESHTENEGLARLYNQIRLREFSSNFQYFILLDQDTAVPKALFERLEEAQRVHQNIKLFLPKIIYKNKLISPARRYWIKGFRSWRSIEGVQSSKYRTAINSGMIIERKWFSEKFTGYDERLRFYGTDDDFMTKYQESERYLYVLNVIIEHHLTLSTLNGTSPSLLKAYREAVSAWGILYSGGLGQLLVRTYIVIHSIYMSLRYRDSSYLWYKNKK